MTEEQSPYKTTWTVDDLSQETGLTPQYIRLLIRQGSIVGSKPGGRDWIVPDSEARRWLEKRRASKNSGH